METTSTYKYARISAFKAREVTREIQGLQASAALDVLTFSPKKAARLVSKTLKSAIANAENNHDARVATLVVKEAVVGEGPTIKRIRPRARGSASPIRKRMAHIRIVLSDEIANKDKTRKRHLSPEAREQFESGAVKAPKKKSKLSTEKPNTTESQVTTPVAETTPATEA